VCVPFQQIFVAIFVASVVVLPEHATSGPTLVPSFFG